MSTVVESQILAALNAGFTLADVKELTVRETLAFCDMWADSMGGNGEKRSKTRKATQADIDRLLG